MNNQSSNHSIDMESSGQMNTGIHFLSEFRNKSFLNRLKPVIPFTILASVGCILLISSTNSTDLNISHFGGEKNQTRLLQPTSTIKTYKFEIETDSIEWEVPDELISPEAVQKVISLSSTDGTTVPNWLELVPNTNKIKIHQRKTNTQDAKVELKIVSTLGNIFLREVIIQTRRGFKVLPFVNDFFISSKVATSNPQASPLALDRMMLAWEAQVDKGPAIQIGILGPDGKFIDGIFDITIDKGSRPLLKQFQNENILLVWNNQGRLYGTIFNNMAALVKGKFSISSSQISKGPELIPLNNGKMLVVWVNKTPNGLYGRIVDNGATQTTNEWVIDSSASYDNLQGIVLQDGNILITWHQQDQDKTFVSALIIDPSGAIVRNAFNISGDVGVGAKQAIKMVLLDNGFVAIAWSANSYQGIYLGLYDPATHTFFKEQKLIGTDESSEYTPNILTLPGNKIFATCTQASASASPKVVGAVVVLDITASQSSSNTQFVSNSLEVFQISKYGGDKLNPTILTNFLTDYVLIGWGNPYSKETEAKGIHLAVYDHNGQIIVKEYQANYLFLQDIYPRVVFYSDQKKVLLLWENIIEPVNALAMVLEAKIKFNNYPEVVKPLENTVIRAGKKISLNPQDGFVDFDANDHLFYTLVVNPYTRDIHIDRKTGEIHGSFSFQEDYSIAVICSDEYFASATMYFKIHVDEPLLNMIARIVFISLVPTLFLGTIFMALCMARKARKIRVQNYDPTWPLKIEKGSVEVSPGMIPPDLEKALREEEGDIADGPVANEERIELNKLQDDIQVEEIDDLVKISIPEEFTCAITQEIMVEPVLVVSVDSSAEKTFEHNYEHLTILRWFKENALDPLTRGKIKKLLFNPDLKQKMTTWVNELTVQALRDNPNIREELERWALKRKKSEKNQAMIDSIIQKIEDSKKAVVKEILIEK